MPRGDNPNSRKNLTREKGFTTETASKYGKMGAAVSNAKQAKRRTMKQELELLLAGNVDVKDKAGNIVATQTRSEAINVALIQRALKGNTRAYELIRDTLGEKPAEIIAIQEIDEETISDVRSIIEEYADKT